MAKEVTPHIEIKNKKLVFTKLNQNNKLNTNNTINYLIENNFIEPHHIKKDNVISNLYQVKFKNSNKYEYVFIEDIKNSGRGEFIRNRQKRVFIRPAKEKILDFISNNKINFIAGYCEFDNHVFLYSNSKYLIINDNHNGTAAPINLSWLMRSIVNNESFIVFNTDKSKYETALITSDFNQVINSINDNNYELNYAFLDSENDFQDYCVQINNFMDQISNNPDVIKFYGKQNRHSINKKFNRNFMQINSNDKEINNEEIQISATQFSCDEVMKKIKEYSTIDPLKIEYVFNDLITNDIVIKHEFKNITGQIYEYHVWNNKENESYQQYDFLVNDNIYIDVKSTWKDNQSSFFISQKENDFRLLNKNNYFIAFFYDIHFDENSYLKYKFSFLDNQQINELDHKINYEYYLNKK